jgi:hypothetical protein
VDITVYLPDELGRTAKAEGLKLSRLLRRAVEDELMRRKKMARTLKEPQTFELDMADEGVGYIGRIKGRRIATDRRGDVEVYLTNDERLLAYYRSALSVSEIAAEDLSDVLDAPGYVEGCDALGIKPIIDL